MESKPLEGVGQAIGQQRRHKARRDWIRPDRDSYLEQFGQSAVRARKLNEFADLLPARAHVLDLGCGAGVPVARDLIARGFNVTGVDASARQIERARCNVPQAQFIRADMTTIEFPAFAFDAVTAFYSITHIPRDQHAPFLKKLAQWIRPGGWFLASFGATALEDWVGQLAGNDDVLQPLRWRRDAGAHIRCRVARRAGGGAPTEVGAAWRRRMRFPGCNPSSICRCARLAWDC